MDLLRRIWSIDWAPAALMLMLMALANVAIFPPSAQDFPLNDDWSYSKGAFAFARGEGIHYNGWASMPLLGMWIVAWPFIQIFGESHLALRFVTLMFAGVGLASFAALLRYQGVALPLRRLAVLTLASYPVVLILTGTFMSDIPGLALSLAALALYVKAFRESNLSVALLALLVSAFGVITRQTVCVAGIAAAIWSVADKESLTGSVVTRRTILALALLPVVFAFGVESWFHTREDALLMNPIMPTPGKLAMVLIVGAFTCSFACLPLLVAQRHRIQLRLLAVLLVACLAVLGLYVLREANLPFVGNTLTRFGVFFESDLMPGKRELIVPMVAALLLVFAGLVGMAFLLGRLIERFRPTIKHPLVLFSLLNLLLIPIAPVFVDRYLIPLLPGAIAIACSGEIELKRLKLGFACAGAFALFGWLVYVDWLSWNSARWKLGREFMARGSLHAPQENHIEGGFEWDGWYSHVDKDWRPIGAKDPGLMLPMNRDLFPNFYGWYAISFSHLPGTRVFLISHWWSPFPPFQRDMYLLARGHDGTSGQ